MSSVVVLVDSWSALVNIICFVMLCLLFVSQQFCYEHVMFSILIVFLCVANRYLNSTKFCVQFLDVPRSFNSVIPSILPQFAVTATTDSNAWLKSLLVSQ